MSDKSVAVCVMSYITADCSYERVLKLPGSCEPFEPAKGHIEYLWNTEVQILKYSEHCYKFQSFY